MGKQSKKKRNGGKASDRRKEEYWWKDVTQAVAAGESPEATRILELSKKKHKSPRDLCDLTIGLFKLKKDDDDKWNITRVTSFRHFFFVMMGEVNEYKHWQHKPATEDDRRVLRRIIRSDTEPAFFRVHAMQLIGLIESRLESDQETFFRCLTDSIVACDGAAEAEKCRSLLTIEGDPTATCHKTVGDYLQERREFAEQFLAKFRGYAMTKWGADGSVHDMSVVPGDMCDGCGAEGNRISTPVCGRCRVTYYCSRRCQENHWNVHKHTCRKEGEFRVGDQVNTLEPFGSVEFGSLCRIVSSAQHSTEDDLWVVADASGEETGILSAENLRVNSHFVRGAMGEEDLSLIAAILREEERLRTNAGPNEAAES